LDVYITRFQFVNRARNTTQQNRAIARTHRVIKLLTDPERVINHPASLVTNNRTLDSVPFLGRNIIFPDFTNHRDVSSLKRDEIACWSKHTPKHPSNVAKTPITMRSQPITIISTIVSTVEISFHVSIVQEVAGVGVKMAV